MIPTSVLLAHGAGASSASAWMRSWAHRLQGIAPVTTFDYPYMAAGSRRPDRLATLVEAHRAERDALGSPVVLMGKSMGGRVGCHVAVEAPEGIAGLVCFGYPLCGAGKRDKLRDEVLKALTVPVLFVQGTRDAMGPLDLFEQVRGAMQAPSTLHAVETGDHSLQVTKTWCKQTGRTQEDVDAEIYGAVKRFVEGLVPPGSGPP